MLTDWLLSLPEWGQALVRVLLVIGPILILVPGFIWWERRLLSWMQDRIGPNRVATFTLKNGKKIRLFGLLQPIADGVKLFFKEDFTPGSTDKIIYFVAPAVALFPAFALAGTLPWGPTTGPLSHWQPIADVPIGVLYFMAVSSLGVYGVVLGGYASNNKYSLLGGLRASAQLISYELAMGMALAAMVLYTGSLTMTQMVNAQMEPLWGVVPFLQNWFVLTPFGLVSAVIFLIAMVAETNRAPFDLPEAENELIAGYHTEYSSMKFAVFFMGEYAAMFVFSGIFATVFLGGFNALPVNWEFLGNNPGMKGVADFFYGVNYWLGPLTFVLKALAGVTFYIWLRATLPRLRYDQLMNLGWKVLLPVAVANFLLVGLKVLVDEIAGPGMGWAAWLGAALLIVVMYVAMLRAYQPQLQRVFGKREVKLVDPKRPSTAQNPAGGAGQ